MAGTTRGAGAVIVTSALVWGPRRALSMTCNDGSCPVLNARTCDPPVALFQPEIDGGVPSDGGIAANGLCGPVGTNRENPA